MLLYRYGVSKYIVLYGVRELDSLLKKQSIKSDIIVNSLTPGACKSDFHREKQGLTKIVHKMMELAIARTAEEGARTLVAAVAAGEESAGAYMAGMCYFLSIHPLCRRRKIVIMNGIYTHKNNQLTLA